MIASSTAGRLRPNLVARWAQAFFLTSDLRIMMTSYTARGDSFAAEKLCLAKTSSASRMARFALCLELKREPQLGQELL